VDSRGLQGSLLWLAHWSNEEDRAYLVLAWDHQATQQALVHLLTGKLSSRKLEMHSPCASSPSPAPSTTTPQKKARVVGCPMRGSSSLPDASGTCFIGELILPSSSLLGQGWWLLFNRVARSRDLNSPRVRQTPSRS
jgi:hypothetical protein